MLYYCHGGEWSHFSVLPYDKTLPWPDCSGKNISKFVETTLIILNKPRIKLDYLKETISALRNKRVDTRRRKLIKRSVYSPSGRKAQSKRVSFDDEVASSRPATYTLP